MLKHSEAIVLRTYPLREADLLVTFFTRAEGKVEGVAKSAKKSRKRFGGALEPGTFVRVYWEDQSARNLQGSIPAKCCFRRFRLRWITVA